MPWLTHCQALPNATSLATHLSGVVVQVLLRAVVQDGPGWSRMCQTAQHRSKQSWVDCDGCVQILLRSTA